VAPIAPIVNDCIEGAMTFSSFSTSSNHGAARVPRIVLAAALVLAMASVAGAQQSFQTPEEAADALASAAKAGDRNALLTVLGRDGEDIVSSGDDVDDAATRQRFVAAYDAKRQITRDGDNKAIMVIGQEDFPFPIPIVRKNGSWQFDSAAGRQEILYRRIGRNELAAIQASLAYVDAQNEYAEKDRTGAGAGIYAQRIVSRPGSKDGLYWPAAQGEEESPLGELVAQAAGEGYRADGRRAPYHGYYYKVLTRQGSNATGGALNYVVGGKMIGGFALVAYPAEYGNSGVMTFVVNHNGTIFQKDLGPQTEKLAARMTSFDPNNTWTKVDATAPAR
jgi:Protein of unknown function (DUF2950)